MFEKAWRYLCRMNSPFTSSELKHIADQVATLSQSIGTWMKSQTIHEEQDDMKTYNNLVTFVDK